MELWVISQIPNHLFMSSIHIKSMVSIRARFFIRIMKLMSLKVEEELNVVEQRRSLDGNTFLFKKPLRVKVKPITIDGINGEWLSPTKSMKNRAILYLHGGSFIAGSPKSHRSLAAHIGKVSESPVLFLDYRLAPENPFPAALEDAISAYEWILKAKHIDPKNVLIVGDSAGGTLTLSTLIKLRDDGQPLPAAGICLSPCTDLAITGESIKSKVDEEIMLTEFEIVEAVKLYLKDEDRKHPIASPFYADLTGLPPLLFQTGTAELLLDDTTRFAEKAKKQGVDVTVDLWSDMFHVFQIFGNLMPESKKALKKIGEYAKKRFS